MQYEDWNWMSVWGGEQILQSDERAPSAHRNEREQQYLRLGRQRNRWMILQMLLCQLRWQWQTFPFTGSGHVWCLLQYLSKGPYATLWHFAHFLYGVLRYAVWISLLWSGLSKNTIMNIFCFLRGWEPNVLCDDITAIGSCMKHYEASSTRRKKEKHLEKFWYVCWEIKGLI